jgi:hypothetical protein
LELSEQWPIAMKKKTAKLQLQSMQIASIWKQTGNNRGNQPAKALNQCDGGS